MATIYEIYDEDRGPKDCAEYGNESTIQQPIFSIAFSTENRQFRLQWSQSTETWNATDLQNLVFSDGSRIVLEKGGNRVRVWRRAGGW